MLTAEYDYDTDIEVQREEAFTEGHKEGFDKGEALATDRMNILITKLIAANRLDDLSASANDPELQRKLFEEFGLL